MPARIAKNQNRLLQYVQRFPIFLIKLSLRIPSTQVFQANSLSLCALSLESGKLAASSSNMVNGTVQLLEVITPMLLRSNP